MSPWRRKREYNPIAGMTREQITLWYQHQMCDYHVEVEFNDDDTVRSITSWLKGTHRPWRPRLSPSAPKEQQ